jgi:hypothetical protein
MKRNSELSSNKGGDFALTGVSRVPLMRHGLVLLLGKKPWNLSWV